ncbi:CidA/LrgA family protein [Clostridium massiliamazoniense]|uniref:CidA/LrgA family protein n=1 Tax=Clostridium massiliamazoniense TaxID=1347366 RepID=UPI0006D839BD|nr:CidA/LrgA family protein [Clostridium massiliamazoniense]
MKLLREMLIILAIYFVSEFISKSLHLPIPGNILGMLILLFLLCTKVVKVEMIDKVSTFLLDHLAFFFIPAGVGIITAYNVLKGNTIKLLIVAIVSTFIIMAISGVVVQLVINLNEKKELKKKELNKNE